LLSLILIPIAALGYYQAIARLPSIQQQPSWTYSAPRNWFGMSIWSSLVLAGLLILVIYCMKAALLRSSLLTWQRIYLYFLGLLVSLPLIWFAVSANWYSPFVYPASCWVGDPIGLLFVPTLTFAADILSPSVSFKLFLTRSLLEIVVVVPIFAWFWYQLSCVLFGWLV